MVHTRPRFGGGRIMENQASEKDCLAMETETYTLRAGSKDISLETKGTRRTFSADDLEKMADTKSEKSQFSRHEDSKSTFRKHQRHDGHFDFFHEKKANICQSPGESLYDDHINRDNVSGEDKRLVQSCQKFSQSSEHHHASLDYDSELVDDKSENISEKFELSGTDTSSVIPAREKLSSHSIKDAVIEHSYGPPQQENDVEKLVSVLDNLGIHVIVKEYNRTHSIADTGRDDKATERKPQVDSALTSRPIDLTCASIRSEKATTHCHQPKREHLCNDLVYCKNLFLKDRKSNYYLVIAEESAPVDLKLLKQQLNAARNLSFADATITQEILGQKSGGINPFDAMRKSARDVRFILHQSLLGAKRSRSLLAFHPLDGSLQVDITIGELIDFLGHFDKRLEMLPADECTDKLSVEESVGYEHKSNKNQKFVKRGMRGRKEEIDASDLVTNLNRRDELENELKNPNVKASQRKQEIDISQKRSESLNQENLTRPSRGQHDDFCKKEKDHVSDDNREEEMGMTPFHEEVEQNDPIDYQTTNSTHPDSHTLSSGLLTPRTSGTSSFKFARKGKLKSFLKKTNKAPGNSDPKPPKVDTSIEENNETENDGLDIIQVPDAELQINDRDCNEQLSTMQAEADGYDDRHEFPYKKEDKIHQAVELQQNVSSPILPEITHFYNRLSDLRIQYQDVYLGISTTRDIGPSLGCKCFFLKDRKRNFVFVITHEYYELDYGRLKQALKPRKKLDKAEAADVLDGLGVQPFRITPFSCTTDRARAKNVMVFITEKIQPSEVILCVQHPFANGRRLVMRSGELQKYLSVFISEIGIVNEKTWPDRYNKIFTRFTDHIDGQTVPPFNPAMDFLKPKESSPNDSDTNGIEDDEQANSNTEQSIKFNLSKTESPYDFLAFYSKSSLWHACKKVSQICLGKIGIINPWMVSPCDETPDVRRSSHSLQALEGSSVDPPLEEAIEESYQARGITYEEGCFTIRTNNNNTLYPPDARKKDDAGTALNVKPDGTDFDGTKFELRSNTLHVNSDTNTVKTLFTVEDIIHHLQETGVEFVSSKRRENRCVGEEESQGTLHSEVLEPMPARDGIALTMGTNFEVAPNDMPTSHADYDLPRDASGQIYVEDEDEDKMKDPNNVENCITLYLSDDRNNHYIIVCGEWDYVSTRRFCRLFHIPGILKTREVNIADVTTTPFSVAQALRGTHYRGKAPVKVYLVLFTSLYLDGDTTCVFRLDQKGTVMRMTSSELENYAINDGMEVWYMP